MKFEDIPFSELESKIFLEAGCWRNYDELEDCLTLDELLLTNDTLMQREKDRFRVQAALAGAEIPDDDQEGADDLPEELLAMERELKAKRSKAAPEVSELTELGLGYQVTKKDSS